MTEKHHNPPLLVVGHLTLIFLFNVEGDDQHQHYQLQYKGYCSRTFTYEFRIGRWLLTVLVGI